MLGARHSLFMRQNRRVALREADLIILAGAVCDFRLDYGRALNKKAKVCSKKLKYYITTILTGQS